MISINANEQMYSCFPSSDVCLLDGLFMAEPPPATAKGIILQKLHLDVEHVSSWRLLTNRKTCNRNINSRLYCFRKKCTEFRAFLPDPGVSGVRSMGHGVFTSLQHLFETLLM